ncbi:hypothetical protein MCR_0689 [Moraxella catarrhalis BBH18]|nr:hypothetical protein MCR_0689 [Moraxella catarrhalis BBH18]AZQ89350.1 hypothetical protein EJK50_0721 [Moraxella catarrhalis]EGE15616.1 hypothetical protein E9K_02851 [Moraxella catarrhalis 103P14B1]EGE23934.1 hypothetical protein E9W_05684 [Moraxella catarrhalis CO72]
MTTCWLLHFDTPIHPNQSQGRHQIADAKNHLFMSVYRF